MRKVFKYRMSNDGKRIMILAWSPAGYDHDDGWFEIGNIKLKNTKNSYLDDWNLEEILASLNSQFRNI